MPIISPKNSPTSRVRHYFLEKIAFKIIKTKPKYDRNKLNKLYCTCPAKPDKFITIHYNIQYVIK